MKIYTNFDLSDRLDSEMGWRTMDLSNIKLQIKSASGISEKTLIRAGITLLYAHWEGFVKKSSEYYLSFVATQKLEYEKLSENFLLHALKQSLSGDMSVKSKVTKQIDFIKKYELIKKDQFKQLNRNTVDMESNLNSVVLANLLILVGIKDTNPYTTKFNLIDKELLKLRNEIAHGEHTVLDKKSFIKLYDDIYGLMRQYKNSIENLASNEEYKKPQCTQTVSEQGTL